MLLRDWQRICFKVSFDQVTATRGLRCKRHVKAASWQITQNAFEPADVFERCGFGHILWEQAGIFETAAANAHQNTLIIKISDVSSRFVFKDSYFCFQHFVAGPGRGTTFTWVMWPSQLPPKKKGGKKKFWKLEFPFDRSWRPDLHLRVSPHQAAEPGGLLCSRHQETLGRQSQVQRVRICKKK